MPKTRHTASGPPGSRTAYSHGCRCDLCATVGRRANALYQRDYRQGLRGTNWERRGPVAYAPPDLAS